MAVRQYVGARYVPKFFENPNGSAEWIKGNTYEALTIVTYLGNSYTSKKPVPINTDITNTDYWVITGNYNEQVNDYKKMVDELFITPEQFGAKGDGVTDDTNALSTALNSGKLIKLSKKYLITNQINFGNSDITVTGGGEIIASSSLPLGSDMLRLTGNNIQNITIENITLNGINISNNAGENALLHIVAKTGQFIRNVLIKNCKLYAPQTQETSRKGIYLDNYNGAMNTDYLKDVFISNCNIDGTNVGIANNRSEVHIDNCVIRNTYWESITIDNGTKNCTVTNCLIGDHLAVNGGGGIGLDYAEDCLIYGNIFEMSNSEIIYYNCITFNSNIGSSKNIIVSNNIFKGGNSSLYVHYNNRHGLLNSYIVNNVFYANKYAFTDENGYSSFNFLFGNRILSGELINGSGTDFIFIDMPDIYNTINSTEDLNIFLNKLINTAHPGNNKYYGTLNVFGTNSPNNVIGASSTTFYSWEFVSSLNKGVLSLKSNVTDGIIYKIYSDGNWSEWLCDKKSIGAYYVDDLNNATESGAYSYNNSTLHAPTFGYGNCLVMKGKLNILSEDVWWITQLAISTNNTLSIRVKIGTSNWMEWVDK